MRDAKGGDDRSSAGYTALELLVVMAIISLVFTSAIVYFNPFTKTARARTAANDMADLMRAARASAITNRSYCTVQIIVHPELDGFLDLDGDANRNEGEVPLDAVESRINMSLLGSAGSPYSIQKQSPRRRHPQLSA